MSDDDDMKSEMAQDTVSNGASGPQVCCPWCKYPVIGLEEAGLGHCPECGVKLDVAELRQVVSQSDDLTGLTYWQLVWRLFTLRPGRKKRRLLNYYLAYMPESSASFFLITASLFASGPVAAAIMWLESPDAGVILFAVTVGYLLLAVAAHIATQPWVRWRLASIGHPYPTEAARRVMLSAATQYLPIGVNVAMFVAGCTCLVMFEDLGSRWALPVVGTGLLFTVIPPVLHLVLWANWATGLDRMIRCESFYKLPRPSGKLLESLNPGLAIAVFIPLFSISAVLILTPLLYGP